MKTLIILPIVLLFQGMNVMAQPKYQKRTDASAISTDKNVKIDPNYKHQAGKQYDAKSDYFVINEEKSSDYSDPNYKHQAGKRKKGKENVLTIRSKEQGTKQDNNYKHQFPSR